MKWSLGSDANPEQDADSAPRRFYWGLVFRNGPFLVGALVLLALIAVALFGPHFASENPYLSAQRSAEVIGGEVVYPPFAPSAQFPLGSDPWGRDILSLLLYGARNTLVAEAFVTMVRLVLGFVLGATAGWLPGSLIDGLIMGAVEVFSSLPLLLTGTILIFALDIRRGLVTFLIALSLVGWGEIAQYIRSEFMALRERPFIEGARAIGLHERQVVSRHVLPNILPQLVVLTLLELGAVLMLLGELGFVGVFIGGGIVAETFDARVVIADIPEWGALLATTRNYLRSAPWMVLYPALAFFVAVLGANLLGEGLRRIIREAGVNTAALVSKRMIVAIAAISLLTWYVVNQIGPGVSYAKLASQVDAAGALTHASAIFERQQDDPGFGTAGARAAAEYIAARLEEYGAQPAATTQSYLQPVERRIVRRLTTPLLEATLEGQEQWIALAHGTDFGERIDGHGGAGSADGALTYVGFGGARLAYRDYRGLNLDGRVVLVLADNAPDGFVNEALIRGAAAVLVITEDAAPRLDYVTDADDVLVTPTLPLLHVRPQSAERWLTQAGSSLGALEQFAADLEAAGTDWATLDLRLRVRTTVALSEPETITGYNVLAILPGNDLAMDAQALMLSSAYDMPEPCPEARYLSAGDGPAGAGIMLEIVRLWRAEDFKPRRAVLLNFWAGGWLAADGSVTYEEERTPYKELQVQAALRLRGVGAGQTLVLTGEGSDALKSLLERSAGVLAVPVTGAAGAGGLTVRWAEAPNPYAGLDTLESLDVESTARAGQVVNLSLITATRQYHY